MMSNNKRSPNRWFTIGVTALIIFGILVSAVILYRQDRALRSEILRHAALAATFVDPREMVALSFSDADRTDTTFIMIEEHLRIFGSSLAAYWKLGERYVGIYTMRRLPDGTILFGPENIPPDDPRASPPGTVYEKPPAALRSVFAEHTPQVTGPYTDEYGTYVSAFVPLLDPQTNTLTAVLGMDIETPDWYLEIGRRSLLPLLLVFSLIIIAISWHLRAVSVRRLREREEEYRLLTENAVSGVAVNEMLFDEQKRPVDYRFLYVNPAFTKHTGLSRDQVLGRRVTEVLPGIEKTSFIERYGKVVLSGEPTSFDDFAAPLGRHYFVNAYRIGKDRFAAVFLDISDRKQAEREREEAHQRLAQLVERLEQKQTQAALLTELRQFLQVCASLPEAGPIIEKTMRRLFPRSNGALYLLSASRSDLAPISRWGRHEADTGAGPILPDECWGLRRGHAYRVKDPSREVVCRHLCGTMGSYLCFPIVAHGEVIGLLHLCESSSAHEDLFLDQHAEIIFEIGELISLAVANIKLRETLTYQSIKDPLTGLFNRRYLEETFVRELSRARRNKYPIGVIMCDIDHFKQFNDLYGHAAGDTVLAEIGRFLSKNLRTADIVCRYGGEEFALILPEASLEHTRMRAEDLCRKAHDLRLSFENRLLGPITLSFGVAGYPHHGESLEIVLRAADAALYRAKQQGRNQVVVTDIPAEENVPCEEKTSH